MDRLTKRALGSSTALAVTSGGMALYLGLIPGAGIAPSAVAIAMGAVGIAATLYAGRLGANPTASSSLTPLTIGKEVSEDVRLKIEELYGLARIYEERNSPLFSAVNGVLTNVQELFSRMSTRLDEQSARIAAVRYADTLSKLNEALGKGYYLDIEAHPELWSNPEERMEAVENALNATGEQLIRNIRQLNSSRDLIYQVTIESLMGSQFDELNRKELGL